jgi:3-oxoacyl-[acyl-carrier-protein] synthase-3
VLFGDGAGAVVLSASDQTGGGLGGLELTADPGGAWSIWIPAGGARRPTSAATVAGGEHYLRMDGRETYRYATRTIAASALTAVERAGWTSDEVDLIVPHQANVRIIESVAKGLGIPMDRFFIDLDRHGNTSAASVPIALSEAVDAGRLQPGTKVVFVAFGAGFTSGAVAMEWTADPVRGRTADDAVRPGDVSVRLPVDWDSVDPIPPALAEVLARPLPGHLDLSNVVPGEPAHAHPPAR